MNNLPWFRMYSESVDDAKLRLLAFEDRWHFVALLCCKCQGVIRQDDPLMKRKVAVKLGLDSRAFDEAMRRLSDVGLIDFLTLEPVAWDVRQMRSDSSAARVAAYRERQKQEVKRDGNVTVTTQDTDTDKETTLSGKPDRTQLSEAKEVIAFLNEKSGRQYRPVPANTNLVIARLNEGVTVDECRDVVMLKISEWGDDDAMKKFLRPLTLFNRTNFEQYIGQLGEDKAADGTADDYAMRAI